MENDTVPDVLSVGDDMYLVDNFTVPEKWFKPTRASYYTIIILREGEFAVTINGKLFNAKAPCLMFLLMNQMVQYHTMQRRPNATCIVMSKRAANRILSNHSEAIALYQSLTVYPVRPIKADDMPIVNLYLASMHEALRNENNPYRLDIAHHLSVALFLSMPQLNNAPRVAKNRNEELLFNFMDLLQENFRNERTIGFYADKLCLSPKHLSRVVKQTSGRTVHDWIDDYVSTEAMAMLHSTDMNVSQVAEALGFASQPLFTRFFQRTTGLNPSEVRRGKQ